jgi:hypothetical protein
MVETPGTVETAGSVGSVVETPGTVETAGSVGSVGVRMSDGGSNDADGGGVDGDGVCPPAVAGSNWSGKSGS